MDDSSYSSGYTYQEIMRQQKQWIGAMKHLEKDEERLKKIFDENKDKIWVFTGCGTSFYLAQTASMLFELITGTHCKVVPSSEILVFPSLVFNSSHEYMLVPISRSGTSTEVVEATQKARTELNIPSLAVSCNYDSSLVNESSFHLTFPFDQEESVVMTGSFTTMLFSIAYFAARMSRNEALLDLLKTLPAASEKFTAENEALIKKIAGKSEFKDFIFLGQGPFYGIANEAGLKMQEMSITVPQSFHTLEYRHGPMSTVTAASLIVVMYTAGGLKYDGQFVKEMKKLGATVLAFINREYTGKDTAADFNLEFPSGYGDLLNVFFAMPLLQLFGYHRAISKNINPDNPRNLSAVVTFDIMGNGKNE